MVQVAGLPSCGVLIEHDDTQECTVLSHYIELNRWFVTIRFPRYRESEPSFAMDLRLPDAEVFSSGNCMKHLAQRRCFPLDSSGKGREFAMVFAFLIVAGVSQRGRRLRSSAVIRPARPRPLPPACSLTAAITPTDFLSLC